MRAKRRRTRPLMWLGPCAAFPSCSPRDAHMSASKLCSDDHKREVAGLLADRPLPPACKTLDREAALLPGRSEQRSFHASDCELVMQGECRASFGSQERQETSFCHFGQLPKSRVAKRGRLLKQTLLCCDRDCGMYFAAGIWNSTPPSFPTWSCGCKRSNQATSMLPVD